MRRLSAIFSPSCVHTGFVSTILAVSFFALTTRPPVLVDPMFTISTSPFSSFFTFAFPSASCSFTPSSLAFFLNGTELQYSVITVTGADTATPDLTAAVFADYTIPVPSGTKFTEGENTFSILVRENSLRGGGNGSTAGPMVDSVSFTTKAVLTWTDHKDNIAKRDDPSSDL